MVGMFYILAAIWLYRRPLKDLRTPLIATLWIAVFLLPPMAAAFSPDARFALRSLYLPSVGIALLLAWVIHTQQAFRRPVVIGVLVTVLLLALGGTVAANRNWANNGKVYRQVIVWNPNHFAGYLGLGSFYEQRGKTELALAQYELSAAKASPEEKADPLEYRARLLGESSRHTQSLELYERLAIIAPGRASIWTGMGNNLWAMGQLKGAAEAYEHALSVEPDDAIACYNLVLVLNQLGRTVEALKYTECAQSQR